MAIGILYIQGLIKSRQERGRNEKEEGSSGVDIWLVLKGEKVEK